MRCPSISKSTRIPRLKLSRCGATVPIRNLEQSFTYFVDASDRQLHQRLQAETGPAPAHATPAVWVVQRLIPDDGVVERRPAGPEGRYPLLFRPFGSFEPVIRTNAAPADRTFQQQGLEPEIILAHIGTGPLGEGIVAPVRSAAVEPDRPAPLAMIEAGTFPMLRGDDQRMAGLGFDPIPRVSAWPDRPGIAEPFQVGPLIRFLRFIPVEQRAFQKHTVPPDLAQQYRTLEDLGQVVIHRVSDHRPRHRIVGAEAGESLPRSGAELPGPMPGRCPGEHQLVHGGMGVAAIDESFAPVA